MVKYNNKDRTAYEVSGEWFLIPAGKRRAPLFAESLYRVDWSYHLARATDDRVKLIDTRDQKALTNAAINGCLNLVLPRFWKYIDYHRRHIAKNIIVDEEWEDEPY